MPFDDRPNKNHMRTTMRVITFTASSLRPFSPSPPRGRVRCPMQQLTMGVAAMRVDRMEVVCCYDASNDWAGQRELVLILAETS
jgi:hypothetical protein